MQGLPVPKGLPVWPVRSVPRALPVKRDPLVRKALPVWPVRSVPRVLQASLAP